MTAPTHIIRQRDYSSGEMVEHAKRRDDEPAVRAGARTMRNVRILASGAVERRPGRSVIFQSGRTEQFRMGSESFKLCFSGEAVVIRELDDTIVGENGAYPWTGEQLHLIKWAQLGNEIYLTFPGMTPRILRWDGISTWSYHTWEAALTDGGQKRVPFKRLSPKNLWMFINARTGTGVPISFSSGMNLTADHVGTRMRFINRQITIASVATPTTGTADINEPLPGNQVLTFAVDPRNTFALDEPVSGTATGSQGYIVAIDATTITVQLLNGSSSPSATSYVEGSFAFQTLDRVVGAGGALIPSAVSAIGNPVGIPIWDDEIFNDMRGWPQSVSSDQNRLIFTDFPGTPEGIGWSAVLTPDDFYPGPVPTDAMFETVPRTERVYDVMGGADEFVITDRTVYYIPISESNPLKPGSVAFRRIPGSAGSSVRPIETAQGVLYVGSGGNRLLAIVGTGQTAMPWVIRPASDLHAHLFSGIRCIAIEAGEGTLTTEHVYVVNGDGSVAVGRYQSGKEWVGWVPWDGVGLVRWVSALGSVVLFTTNYPIAGTFVELLDTNQYLDCGVVHNLIPPGVAVPPTGETTFWFLGGYRVAVMQGNRYLGTRPVTGLGALVNEPGETFTNEKLGHDFEVEVEPFMAHMQPGQSVKQSLNPRNVTGGAVTVQNSTGFKVQRYKTHEGEWETLLDRAPYDAGENQSLTPPLREESKTFPGVGADHDPRIRVIKDFPGPLRILEIAAEVGA